MHFTLMCFLMFFSRQCRCKSYTFCHLLRENFNYQHQCLCQLNWIFLGRCHCDSIMCLQVYFDVALSTILLCLTIGYSVYQCAFATFLLFIMSHLIFILLCFTDIFVYNIECNFK